MMDISCNVTTREKMLNDLEFRNYYSKHVRFNINNSMPNDTYLTRPMKGFSFHYLNWQPIKKFISTTKWELAVASYRGVKC